MDDNPYAIVPLLSTGDKSTLGSYLKLCKQYFGPASKATACIQNKIDKSPGGEDEVVLADESQMVGMLQALAAQGDG